MPISSIGGGRHQGTWVIKELVDADATWISPKFHVQVIRAYDALVTSKAAQCPLSRALRPKTAPKPWLSLELIWPPLRQHRLFPLSAPTFDHDHHHTPLQAPHPVPLRNHRSSHSASRPRVGPCRELCASLAQGWARPARANGPPIGRDPPRIAALHAAPQRHLHGPCRRGNCSSSRLPRVKP